MCGAQQVECLLTALLNFETVAGGPLSRVECAFMIHEARLQLFKNHVSEAKSNAVDKTESGA